MKKLALHLAMSALMLGGGSMSYSVLAQTNTTAPAAGDHAQLEAAIQKLGLSPRQKIQIAKIVREAKANGQDKLVTAEQVSAVLTPDQKAQLTNELKAAKTAAPATP